MGKALALRSDRLTSVERAMITEGKRKKYTVKVPWLHLCQPNMDICLPRQTERWTLFSFLTLLQKPSSWFQRPLLSWPPAATPSCPQIQRRSFISRVLLTVTPTAKPNVFCLFSNILSKILSDQLAKTITSSFPAAKHPWKFFSSFHYSKCSRQNLPRCPCVTATSNK